MQFSHKFLSRRVGIWIMVVLLVWMSQGLGTKAYADQVPLSKSKATWLWDTSLISTDNGRTEILQFALSQQVGRIFLQVNPDVANDAYRSFISTAAANGIAVHALDGAPQWALPENRQKITDLVNWVKAYNASVAANERFAGIQVDIEPYLLPQWSTDQNTVVLYWQQSLKYFNDLVKKDTALTTAAAVPFWLDSITLAGGSGTLSEAIMPLLDETAIMSYRDSGQEVVQLAANELATGDRLGKMVWVGVETNPAPDTPFITFYEEGKAAMNNQLALIDGLLKDRPSYAGIAVHDYAGWRSLKN
ncbi:hypothetical protein O9H85_15570 [Paenibacillus filicis]|uniref:Amidase n=1 Tax=Paenibacillus gyeongsangnamensis TaxID=3388067 RepID=A0ABT4QAB2_9BACL|nr:hypothetical protein [Paenibacillus filicis]MCZ8513828.1 hypothetical protein [Paenibacillus filicis]